MKKIEAEVQMIIAQAFDKVVQVINDIEAQ